MERQRKEWVRSKANVMGEYSLAHLAGKENSADELKRAFWNIFRKLVTVGQYAKVMTKMTGEEFSDMRVSMMARSGKLNKFVISGYTFILLTQGEYDVYIKIFAEDNKKVHDHAWRMELMRQPKTREEADRFRRQRKEAYDTWKSGSQTMFIGGEIREIEGEYVGQEWDTFFTEVMPTYEDRFSIDSINKWLEVAEYFPVPDSESGVTDKRIIAVGELWDEYKEYCKDKGYVAKYVKQFSIYMKDKGFRKRFVDGNRSFEVYTGAGEFVGASEASKEDWLELIAEGEHLGHELYDSYVEWSVAMGLQPIGRTTFYTWMESDGWKRESKSGVLWMSKGGNG